MGSVGQSRTSGLPQSVATLLVASLLLGQTFFMTKAANAATPVFREVVTADFTTATLSGTTIINTSVNKLADLTVSGTPSGIGTASGLTFTNTTTGSTNQYLTGNLGNTSLMQEIVVEFEGSFTDTGCAAQNQGSMVFALGRAGSFVPYNIYRHSNFIGFNTFASDLYGIQLPASGYNTYKFVMLPGISPQASQEIWVNGVKQTLVQRTSTGVSPCAAFSGVAENVSNRVFTGGTGSFTDGSFMVMSHPTAANTWGSTGSLRNLKISTRYSAPGAPSIGTITPGSGQLSVAFSAPASNGGSAITGYKYSTDNGVTWISAPSSVSPIVITGLTGGTNYNVRLLAVNLFGDGSASTAVVGTPTVIASAPTPAATTTPTATPATVPAASASAPIAPQALAATGPGNFEGPFLFGSTVGLVTLGAWLVWMRRRLSN